MRVLVVLPAAEQGPVRTYAGHACRMSVSDTLEIDLPVKDGSGDVGGSDVTVLCDLSMLPDEFGRRAARALELIAGALREGDCDFLWSEPDPGPVGIALQVLICLPDRNTIRKGPLYRIAFHEVAPDVGAAGDRASSLDRHGQFVSAKGSVGNGSRCTKRYFNAKEAAAYLGLSAKTLNRMRAPGKGPRYTKRGRRVIYDVVDLDEWMAEGKRRSTDEDEDQ